MCCISLCLLLCCDDVIRGPTFHCCTAVAVIQGSRRNSVAIAAWELVLVMLEPYIKRSFAQAGSSSFSSNSVQRQSYIINKHQSICNSLKLKALSINMGDCNCTPQCTCAKGSCTCVRFLQIHCLMHLHEILTIYIEVITDGEH